MSAAVPSGKAPTMRDVAAAAGVSKALVSMVFRDAPGVAAESRANILAVAEQLGYRQNRSASMLARRRSHVLGVTLQVGNSYHAVLVEHLQAAADELGYQLLLSASSPSHSEIRALDTLLDFRCEATILLGTELTDAELAVAARQAPLVVVGRRVEGDGIDVVRPAEEVGMALAVDHLVGLGHSRITHVDGGDGAIAADRRRGYEHAMAAHGLVPSVVAGGWTGEEGRAAVAPLVAAPAGPTAVIAFNDSSAVGVLDACRRAGISVPDQVSVVGIDDGPLATLPGIDLTTLGQQPRLQARWAVSAAVQRLDEGRTVRAESVVDPVLVVRGTTAAPAR